LWSLLLVSACGGGEISEAGRSRDPQTTIVSSSSGVGGSQAGGAGQGGASIAGSSGSGGEGHGYDASGGWSGLDGAGSGSGGNGASVDTPVTCLRTVQVSNAADLTQATSNAKPGDCVVLADGNYTFPVIRAQGTEASPIVIRAANTSQATVTTGNLVLQGAAYVQVQGLTWSGSGTIHLVDCDHCRFSRSRVQRNDRDGEEWVTVEGTSKNCRIDHNDFGPQSHTGNMVQLSGTDTQVVQYTRIDHNFFHDVHYTGGNGWECIRAGLSSYSFSSAHSIIEQNFFFHAANDPEVISIKSSDNVVRNNTMRASAGQFSLRHGNRNMMYGNYILGDGVGNAQGIRVCGSDHKLFNNYVQEVGSPAIYLEGGESIDTSGQLTDHKQVYRAMLLFNTIVNGEGIVVGGSHSRQPVDCTIAYNVLQGSGPLLSEASGTQNTTYVGNIVNGRTSITRGTIMVDPKLVKTGDVFSIGSGSPAIDAATQPFTFVTDDIEGKPRVAPDIGANEISSAPAMFGLLKLTDVGPMAP